MLPDTTHNELLLISQKTSAQSSLFKCDKLINNFSKPWVCDGNPCPPIMRSIHLTPVWRCVSGLPKMMSWGLLLTPTPALVPAATSTRYCTPVCRPPTTTERMVASTDLLTWNRVSLAKHQIWHKHTWQTEFTVRWYSTRCTRWRFWGYLVLLDDAVLLFSWRRVPWHADWCAVMASYCQHCDLLWRCTWCLRWWQNNRNKGNT